MSMKNHVVFPVTFLLVLFENSCSAWANHLCSARAISNRRADPERVFERHPTETVLLIITNLFWIKRLSFIISSRQWYCIMRQGNYSCTDRAEQYLTFFWCYRISCSMYDVIYWVWCQVVRLQKLIFYSQTYSTLFELFCFVARCRDYRVEFAL